MKRYLKKESINVPIWEKYALSVEEAAEYTGLGVNKIRTMSNSEKCPFVIWNGNKRMLKRQALTNFLETQYSI